MDHSQRDSEAEFEQLKTEYADFLYLVSHDLFAPVRRINAFLEIFEQHLGQDLDDKGRQYLDYIHQSSDQLHLMLNGLLRLSRLNTSEQSFCVFDLGQLSRQIWAERLGDIKPSDAVLNIDVQSLDAIKCFADQDQIATVLEEILKNSILYRRQDVPLHINMVLAEASDRVKISITDNGMGLDVAHRKDMLQPLRRAVAPDQFPGIGIGLALVDKIVKQHNGRSSIYAPSHQGLTVAFTLPNSRSR